MAGRLNNGIFYLRPLFFSILDLFVLKKLEAKLLSNSNSLFKLIVEIFLMINN